MTTNSQHPKSGASNIARSYGWTAVFSLGIAVLLTLVSGQGFLINCAVSLCIGWSITTAFVLLEPFLESMLPPWLLSIPITALGLLMGLLVAGQLVLGRYNYFFTDNFETVYLGIFFGVIGYLVLGSRAHLKAKLDAQIVAREAERAEQEKRLAETQLRLLQAQIEPHFLFNTLSNVSSMVRSNPEGAERTLDNLSHLLRNSLRRTREAQTTVGDELDLLRAYLEIQSIRMGARLTYEIAADATLRALPLPPMLLQPLVENAVLHGIEPAEAGGTVHINLTTEDQQLLATVIDTGVGIHADQATSENKGDGVGLTNVRARLRALHGDQASLALRDNPGGGVRAELRLPLEPGAAA